MQASRFAPDGWRRASCIGDGSWSTLSPTWAWTCTKIRSRSRLQRRAGGVGYPRSPASASGGGARPATGPSAIERILAAPRPSLQPASLDTDPSALAGRTEVRASGASYRAGGLHRSRRGGDGTARSSRSTHQGGATGVVTRTGGAGVAGAARHGTGGSSDPGGGTRRHHPLRQSTPAYGVSRLGAVRALQRGHAASGQDHQGGNGAARRMLIEAAWSYRFPARISRELLLRQEGLARSIRDTAWKAQERLCRRYRKLARAGKPPTVVTTAIARELTGFVWAIAYQVESSGALIRRS